jgi:hypothetical protein
LCDEIDGLCLIGCVGQQQIEADTTTDPSSGGRI